MFSVGESADAVEHVERSSAGTAPYALPAAAAAAAATAARQLGLGRGAVVAAQVGGLEHVQPARRRP